MSKIINEAEFNEMMKQQGVTVIDFFADWCPPCKIMAPIFDATSKDLAEKSNFVKINVDKDGIVAAKYRVTNIPTILIFKDGEVKDRIVGVVPQDVLKTKVLSVIQN